MSGIYGLALRYETDVSGRMKALEKTNAIYGAAGSDSRTGAGYAVGCHLEHFSQDFPCGDPVMSIEGQIAVIDALLFNREELLPATGLKEDTSDEELLLRLILKNGPEALRQVNGDFAGVIFDTEKRRWLMFRDQTGVRPLYVYRKDGVMAFSTDIRALLKMPGADLAADEMQIYLGIMGGNSNSADATEFAHIRMLEAGHYAWIGEDEQGFSVEKSVYYTPGKQKIRLRNRRAYEQRLYELTEDAVNRRLRAVPGMVGAELSGGLDSGVIDVFINRAGRKAKYLSWSPPVEEHPIQEDDERILIEQLCRQEQIECSFLPIDKSSRMELLNRPLPPHAHTPRVGDTAEWMAGHGIRAVFSGHGGDEGASHRMSIVELWEHREYLAYANEVYRELKGRNLRIIRTAVRIMRQIRAGKRYVRPWWRQGGNDSSLLSDAFREKMSGVPLPELSFGYAPEKFVAAGGQRSRVDNAAFQAAEHGVRYLFPLMDHRVMTFALGIPRRMYLKNGQKRLVFRKAFEGILPLEMIRQTRKNSPGIDSVHVPGAAEDYKRSIQRLLSGLDVERWSRYWSKDLLLRVKETAGTEDCPLDEFGINTLYICWLIQQWQDGRWKDE